MGGLADTQRSLDLAVSIGSPEAARAQHNVAALDWFLGDLALGTQGFAEATEVAERLGATRLGRASRANHCGALRIVGRWDEA
jgi:hypothetical protein